MGQAPVQAPSVAVSVAPACGMPEMAGAVTTDGPLPLATTPVGGEGSWAEP
jgi:hypothetical protein